MVAATFAGAAVTNSTAWRVVICSSTIFRCHRGQRQSEHRRGQRGWRAQGCPLPRDHGLVRAPHRVAQTGESLMDAGPSALHAFAAYGIELEYMIVDRDTLAVMPIADRLLQDAAGHAVADVDRGRFAWSNEIVLHLVEIKNARPGPALEPQIGRAHV